jgi:hypothetical protein
MCGQEWVSHVEEDGFARTLKNNIPLEGIGSAVDLVGDKLGAARGIDQTESEVLAVAGLVWEVDACDEAADQAAGEDGDGEVRSLQRRSGSGTVWAGDAAGFDGG